MGAPMPSRQNDIAAAPEPKHRWSRLQSAPMLLFLLAVWLLATPWLRPLLLPDEGRYSGVAREMWLGDALVPTLNGLPYFHKPPLFYWIGAGAMQLLGDTVFAARVASVLASWLMGATLLLAMRRWHGPRVAAVALGVLATTPFFFIGGQYANHDMLVGGLITAAVLALARALDEPPRVHLGWLVAGWVLCALAMLSKGLIGVVLPALVIGPWLLVQGRWRQMLGLLHPFGLLAFVVVAAPWFVAMQLRFPGFFDYFFMEQHFRRFSQASFNNPQPAWFYLVVMPLLTLPWVAWLPAAVKRLWPRPNATLGLYAWWVVAVLGFFTLPSSKLVGYAMPALAPWCALLALAVAQPPGRAWRWVMGAAALVCVAIIAALAWEAPKSSRVLARTLAAKMAPTDTVVMVDEYLFDLAFYARLRQPVIVASRWDDPELPKRDSPRKELFDAARFDPALGARLLQPIERLDTMACGASAVWFIVPTPAVAQVAGLTGAARVFGNARSELWRAPGRSCS
jgi:4-amino-4-deoxy-L-arabinose transferase-like glycosyltransferase